MRRGCEDFFISECFIQPNKINALGVCCINDNKEQGYYVTTLREYGGVYKKFVGMCSATRINISVI